MTLYADGQRFRMGDRLYVIGGSAADGVTGPYWAYTAYRSWRTLWRLRWRWVRMEPVA